MTWILGIGQPHCAPVLTCCAVMVAAACSTDVEYLRAGNAPSSNAAGVGPGGRGGDGGAGGSPSDDAGDAEADADAGTAEEDTGGGPDEGSGAGGGSPDAAEAGRPAPTVIRLGVPSPSDILAPSPGGMNYTDQCSMGVVIGAKGTVDAPGTTGLAYLKSIAMLCGTLGISGNGPFQVTTTPTGLLPQRGDMPGTVVQEHSCPANQVVVGFESRAAMYVDQLAFRCAPLTIVETPQGYALSIGTSTQILPVGGAGGNVQRSISCPTGQLAVGSVLRAGNAIDAFGVGCAPALPEIEP